MYSTLDVGLKDRSHACCHAPSCFIRQRSLYFLTASVNEAVVANVPQSFLTVQ
jgi:hypothetical protein